MNKDDFYYKNNPFLKMISKTCCDDAKYTGGAHHTKECLFGIDPNDLQGNCDHRKWDAATDACALCGKAWNTILWHSGAKPCCGGMSGPGPYMSANGGWHNIDCDSLKAPNPTEYKSEIPQIDYRPKVSRNRCECGAHATSNPNAHAFWCPEHKK